METIRLIGRGSRLSLLQLEKAKQRIESAFPGLVVQVIARSSRGDALPDTPLHTVEGIDFFTQEIFDALSAGEADIAVHSLKDMSSEHFFGENKFAIIDRDDVRDVAIFHRDIGQKITEGQIITIGTCSPRREEMATVFLRKALPQLHHSITIATKSIRGNVDTRLRKLDQGEYDGIILATAGLNRLLESPEDSAIIRTLLSDKKLMLLPLVECVPAPCQGAIVAEAIVTNKKAVAILDRINDRKLMNNCIREKQVARLYGAGCLQRFGVTTFGYGDRETVYAAGRDIDDRPFSNWTALPELDISGKNFFSTTDFMGSFFKYDYPEAVFMIDEPVIYIANYKAIAGKKIIGQLQQKKIWAAGTRTWYELAKKGVWVEGCADAFGLETLEQPWQMPLFGIEKKEAAIITNAQSADIWRAKGWKVYATYELVESFSATIHEQISRADIIFWTSYRQYIQYKNAVKEGIVHACPFGETAEQLKASGKHPVVFPGIKAFQQWRQTYNQ